MTSVGENDVFKATMTVDSRTYNPTNTSYSVTTTQTNGDYSSSEIATNTRKATSEALERYNRVLKSCTGLQLGDLGFGNYPKSIIDPTGIKLNTTALMITAGTKYTLKATISPSNATNKTVYWSSSNTSVAGMQSGGVVNAKKAGTCTVTAKTVNGKTATCKVTVKPAPSGVSLNYSSVTMSAGTTFTLKATVSPSSALNKTVTWSTSSSAVATVSSSGVVSAKKAGTCTITAKTFNGKTATCKVTVKSKAVKPTYGVTYILNTNSHKFHYQNCSYVSTMNEANKKVYNGSRDSVIAMGYTPCSRCNP